MNNNPQSFLNKLLAGCVVAAVLAAAATQAADVSGSWTWTTPGRNGGPDHTTTLTQKADGAALSGKIANPGRDGKIVETPIADGKVDGDNITFAVVRQVKGNSVTNNYSGTLAADKITGKISFIRDGDLQSRDWVAQHAPATN